MRDLRNEEMLSTYVMAEAEHWRNAQFVWKRRGASDDPQEHDHCRFCSACI